MSIIKANAGDYISGICFVAMCYLLYGVIVTGSGLHFIGKEGPAFFLRKLTGIKAGGLAFCYRQGLPGRITDHFGQVNNLSGVAGIMR